MKGSKNSGILASLFFDLWMSAFLVELNGVFFNFKRPLIWVINAAVSSRVERVFVVQTPCPEIVATIDEIGNHNRIAVFAQVV